jgi:hypothetical protein
MTVHQTVLNMQTPQCTNFQSMNFHLNVIEKLIYIFGMYEYNEFPL